jgi:hypothetical protein
LQKSAQAGLSFAVLGIVAHQSGQQRPQLSIQSGFLMVPPAPQTEGIPGNFAVNHVVHFPVVLKFLVVLPVQSRFRPGQGKFQKNQIFAGHFLHQFVPDCAAHHTLAVLQPHAGGQHRSHQAKKEAANYQLPHLKVPIKELNLCNYSTAYNGLFTDSNLSRTFIHQQP